MRMGYIMDGITERNTGTAAVCIPWGRWAWLCLLPLLAACGSMQSGMRFDRSVGDYTDNGVQDANAANTQLKLITSQLVKQEQSARAQQSSQDISRLVGRADPYQIEPGDILSIVVWDHPELSGAVMAPGMAGIAGVDSGAGTVAAPGFVVDHQGMVQFPYAGKLKLAGMTEDEARQMLTSKLAFYINKPVVTLRIQSYRSKRIYVDGEVKAPGMHPINDIPMTLVEAINRAGGMLPSADQSQISLVRDGETYWINLPEMVQRGVNPSTILLVNGDVLRVLSRDANKVFVSGEVIQPRALPMHNGRLTLNEALGEAGGINPLSGDASQIYVVRKSASEPVVYRLDAHAPGALALAESFELLPKDVVYVAATPLANWHRTISQILPGALSSAVGSVNQPR